jgi:putative RNA 2'-phosphotransferase
MDKHTKVNKGKFLALLLRHKPEVGNLTLDQNGWAPVDGVLKALEVTIADLETIVAEDDKGRYEFSIDGENIRARQGHSINVDVELHDYVPTEKLYHGTHPKALDAILQSGLKSMSRLYVHLSKDVETATKVGSRRGAPMILTIDAVKAHTDGVKFWISKNGVVLAKEIPADYISI